MRELMVVENSKSLLKKTVYNLRYGRKFKKFNIDKNFADLLIERSTSGDEKEIFKLVKKSKDKAQFENEIREYFKSDKKNIYASTLLIGNVTGKYVFGDFYYRSTQGLNIDAFSSENEHLIKCLRDNFVNYTMDNNKRKNTFAERIAVDGSTLKDLSLDIDEERLTLDFDKVTKGEQEDSFKNREVVEYIMKTIGTYSQEDIEEHFDFILQDINSDKTESLEERRHKYMAYKELSSSQIKKINEVGVLKSRLQDMGIKESEQLLQRIGKIENSLVQNISELEDVYSDYELLYRDDLVSKLYVPEKDITIIEDYKDMKPQLIHQFIRNPQKFKAGELEKAKAKIIAERTNGNESDDLTATEKERLDKLASRIDAELNQYKTNYSTDGKGSKYTDATGFDSYHSDTSNQISATLFNGEEFLNSSHVGIIGVGFNSSTLTSEAIAISSNSYKTTNKGIYNIEYDEDNEFAQMSAPFSELKDSQGKSEVVMYRNGMDFDTKASYIFALIDSSNPEQTADIMGQLEKVKNEEELKVVVYDLYKIRESLNKEKKIERENDSMER